MPSHQRELVNVEAVVNIQQVLARYCRGMDRMDAPITLDCFDVDADLSYTGLFKGGPQQFVDWLWPIHASLVGHTHQLHNVTVAAAHDGVTSVSEAYVTVTLRAAQGAGFVDLIGKGRYFDEWSVNDGVWRIRRRRFVSDLTTVNPVGGRDDFPPLLRPAVADPPQHVGTRDTNDLSYDMGGWRVGH